MSLLFDNSVPRRVVNRPPTAVSMAGHEADMQSSASATADFGPLLNLAIWTLAGSATVFLGLRLFAKHRGQRALWYDDYLLIAAWVCHSLPRRTGRWIADKVTQVSVIISCIMQTVDTTFGFGKEHRDIDAGILATTRLVSTAAGFFLILAAAWSKTSFALTLLRISEGWPKKLVLFVIWTTNIAIGVSAITQWAQCWPLARLWEGEGVEGQCLPLGLINGYNMFVSGYSGLMDISLALLPWVIVRPFDNLAPSGSTRRKEKFGIVVAMGMAVL